jgi:hypothetical protein
MAFFPFSWHQLVPNHSSTQKKTTLHTFARRRYSTLVPLYLISLSYPVCNFAYQDEPYFFTSKNSVDEPDVDAATAVVAGFWVPLLALVVTLLHWAWLLHRFEGVCFCHNYIHNPVWLGDRSTCKCLIKVLLNKREKLYGLQIKWRGYYSDQPFLLSGIRGKSISRALSSPPRVHYIHWFWSLTLVKVVFFSETIMALMVLRGKHVEINLEYFNSAFIAYLIN